MTGPLVVRLRGTVGAFGLDVGLELAGSSVHGIFGPSGSGKTTVLRCVAGFNPHVGGTVSLDGEVWQDEGVFVSPDQRGIGFVTQHADLFPHLTVEGNLRYAQRRAVGPADAVPWDHVVTQFELGALLSRGTESLSGGERQRVALGRALLTAPRLLMLDEPVSALDAPIRRSIMQQLDETLRDLSIPVLYVSHSLSEVSRFADHLVWLRDGRVAQSGTVADVVSSDDFASWIGEEPSVVLGGVLVEHDDDYGLSSVDTPIGRLTVPRRDQTVGDSITLQIRSRDVSLGPAPQGPSSMLNEVRLPVVAITDQSASECLVRMGETGTSRMLLARITRKSCVTLGLEAGQTVYARVKSVAVLD